MQKEKVVVLIEKKDREVAALAKLFSVQLMLTGYRQSPNVTAAQRIRDKVQYVFRSVHAGSHQPHSSQSLRSPEIL